MIGCIIQARTGSTRLPGKTMMPVDENDTVLSFGIKQVQFSKLIEKIVIATTDLPEDDLIVEHIKKLNVNCFRGQSKDVLDRYYQCAKKFNFSIIVRITSDCPLIDPIIIDSVISNFLKNQFDYLSNVHPVTTFPTGTDVEVFSFESLEKSWNEAKKPSEREHVTPYLYTSDFFKIGVFKNYKDLSHLRWTIDYKQDLDLICEIVNKITTRPILMNNILDLFLKNPNLKKLNEDVLANELCLKSLKEDEAFL
jgi:spore coat polysaccharide biosynthesis protein SpsF